MDVLQSEGVRLGLFAPDTTLTVTPLAFNPLNAVTGAINAISWEGGSAVRKHVTHNGDGADHWAPSQDPQHFNYWRREVLAYTTDLPARLKLDAPALLGHETCADGSHVLWLEKVEGRTGLDVTMADLERTAYDLGAGQGRREQPQDDWLSRSYIRTYGASKPSDYRLLEDAATWRHPLVARNWPPAIRTAMKELNDHRGWYQDLLDRLPRTVCHLDVWPNNLVVRANGSPALLDWSFTGEGAIGEDISNLIPDAVLDLLVPASDIEQLEASVIDGYLQGLESAEFEGDPTHVLLAVYAAAVKYHWLAPIFLSRLGDEEHLAYGRPIDPDVLYAERGVALELLARWAAKARTLARELGFS
ncbi:MAG: phosphotransferase [Acidimicrobiales bacterium]